MAFVRNRRRAQVGVLARPRDKAGAAGGLRLHSGRVCYLLGAGALSQVVIAVVGDGYYELVKHSVLSGYATALLLAVGRCDRACVGTPSAPSMSNY